ncbi:MAG: hypothetical protein BWX45_01025 [Deltaproteobacteria bacterium ADurb.Bin002]|nr:MAG: hypothetical protein BWX45_01025 [Deltaproteobacteria bacterium ADurb.Bin002]
MGRQNRSKGAAGPMGIVGSYPFCRILVILLAVIENIHAAFRPSPGEMPPLDHHFFHPQIQNDGGGFFHVLHGTDFHARQKLSFGNIRRHNVRQRKQLFHQRLPCPVCHQGASALGDHHRIHYDIFETVLLNLFHNSIHRLRGHEHAGFDRIRADIPQHRIQLRRNPFRRHRKNRLHPP